MSKESAAERSIHAALAATASWENTPDRQARVAPAHRAAAAKAQAKRLIAKPTPKTTDELRLELALLKAQRGVEDAKHILDQAEKTLACYRDMIGRPIS